MYSCLHCEIVSSNRNSFNRHLREHLGTDVEFLRNRITEENHQKSQEEEADAWLENVEETETEEMDTDADDVDETLDEDITDISIEEETFVEDTEEDISSILERYQHFDCDDSIKHETDLDDSEVSGDDHLGTFEDDAENEENIDDGASSTKEEDEELKKERKEITKKLNRTGNKSKPQGIGYACNQCDKKYSKRRELKQHIESTHGEIKYPCQHCQYQATNKGHLIEHVQALHEGIKFPCDYCDFQSKWKNHLRSHIKRYHHQSTNAAAKPKKELKKKTNNSLTENLGNGSKNYERIDLEIQDTCTPKHQSMMYHCNDCEYQTKSKGHLKKHVEARHMGIKYPCTHCSHNSSQLTNLRTHMKRKHNQVMSKKDLDKVWDLEAKRKRSIQNGN